MMQEGKMRSQFAANLQSAAAAAAAMWSLICSCSFVFWLRLWRSPDDSLYFREILKQSQSFCQKGKRLGGWFQRKLLHLLCMAPSRVGTLSKSVGGPSSKMDRSTVAALLDRTSAKSASKDGLKFVFWTAAGGWEVVSIFRWCTWGCKQRGAEKSKQWE